VVLSEAARKVLAIEHGMGPCVSDWLDDGDASDCRSWDVGDITAPAASGSAAPAAMLVIPCSMGTAARIAAGLSSNLIERAADVMIKERRPLVIVPRETPLSTLHLRNLLALSELDVRVVPAMPGFYGKPESVEDLIAFVVDRALAAAGLELPLRRPWRDGDPAGAEPA
jgi:4-hydroxy-3-polyprenylbenzoate decarboxylase